MNEHQDGASSGCSPSFPSRSISPSAPDPRPGNARIDCHGGYGYAEQYDVERKSRDGRLYKTAPINDNLVLAYVGEHGLGMPRSY